MVDSRGRQMKGMLDVAKMEAAFKRAADKAMHGTREERSGRFLPKQPPVPTTPRAPSAQTARRQKQQ
jgi:hypothetical protein